MDTSTTTGNFFQPLYPNKELDPINAIRFWCADFDRVHKAFYHWSYPGENRPKKWRIPDPNDDLLDPWGLYRVKLWATLNASVKKLPPMDVIYGHYFSIASNRALFLEALVDFCDENVYPDKDKTVKLQKLVDNVILVDPATVKAFTVIDEFWTALGEYLTELVIWDMYGNSADSLRFHHTMENVVEIGNTAVAPCACRKITPQELAEIGKEKDECAICRLPFFETYETFEQEVDETAMTLFDELPLKTEQTASDNAPVQLPCGHVFGVVCITASLKAGPLCPLCQKSIWLPPQNWWNVNPRGLDPVYAPDGWETLVSNARLDRSIWGDFAKVELGELLKPCVPTEGDEDLPIGFPILYDVPICMGLVARRLSRPELGYGKFAQGLTKALGIVIAKTCILKEEEHPFRTTVETARRGLRENTDPWNGVPKSVNGSDKLVAKC